MDNNLKNLYSKAVEHNQSLLLSDSAKNRVKQKVFGNLNNADTNSTTTPSLWYRLRHSLLMRSYVLAPLLVLLFVVSTTVASADSVPGDVLYPFKRQVETARIFLAPSNDAKVELELNFAEERIRELEKIREFSPVGASAVSNTESKNSATGQQSLESQDDDLNYIKQEDSRKQKAKIQIGDAKSIEREQKAREQAEHAIEFMEKTRKEYQDKEKEQAKELEKKIEEYRKKVLEQHKDREEEKYRNEDSHDQDSNENDGSGSEDS